jgi:DNA polymerase sigma
MSVDSDVDLVICFPDEHQELPQKCGVLPLLQQLAVFLREQHPQWLRIQKFIIHARVPVIKATAFDGEATVSLDITVDGPAHTGLATTEFVRNVIAYLPPIVPLVHILRQFLKENSLDNAYTGNCYT